MEKILSILLAIFVCACNAIIEKSDSLAGSAKGIAIDPLRKKYILERIHEKDKGVRGAYFFIFPSFCGACTDSIMNLIRGNTLKTFYHYYVYRDVDSTNSLTEIFPGGRTKFMDALELGRYGMEAAHNQIYLFEDTTCIYHAKLSAETVPQVRKELEAIESNAQSSQ